MIISAIASQDRDKIRSRVLRCGLGEPNDKLATQNAIVIAKIARSDFPAQWPDLFDNLIELIKMSTQPTSPPKQLSRVLLITHHVVKELATVRLQRARVAFFSVAPQLFALLWQLYLFRMHEWQGALQNSYSDFSLDVLNKMSDNERILKIVRRLITAGYEYPHRDSQVCETWPATRTHTEVSRYILRAPRPTY